MPHPLVESDMLDTATIEHLIQTGDTQSNKDVNTSKRRSFTQHCMGKRWSFAHTMLTKRPLFSRVYDFVGPSVPRLLCLSFQTSSIFPLLHKET